MAHCAQLSSTWNNNLHLMEENRIKFNTNEFRQPIMISYIFLEQIEGKWHRRFWRGPASSLCEIERSIHDLSVEF